jgi:hypothetical protein
MFSLCMAFAVFVLGFFALLFNVSRLVAVVDDEGWLVDIQMGRGRTVIQVCLSTTSRTIFVSIALDRGNGIRRRM